MKIRTTISAATLALTASAAAAAGPFLASGTPLGSGEPISLTPFSQPGSVSSPSGLADAGIDPVATGGVGGGVVLPRIDTPRPSDVIPPPIEGGFTWVSGGYLVEVSTP
jgi:hypothetical protein